MTTPSLQLCLSAKMKTTSLLALFAAISLFETGSSDYIPVIVEESGTEDVAKFATVIRFYLDLVNNGKESINVTIIPNKCCLVIEEGDIDCEVMELRPQVNLIVGPKIDQYHDSNSVGKALFMFRNLYTRYRRGNCTFEIVAEEGSDAGFVHTLFFDTTPEELYVTSNCTGVDQDPDRGCSPADCAIKYRGRRNFYRNATGKCEVVVECDTRGRDGVDIVAYYDWESNVCHRLDFEDNTFSQVESDTEIPVEIDPSQSVYFPNLEPQRLKNIIDGEEEKIECNNGIQNGIYCDCDEGWMSSGIHEEDPFNFHWCDTQQVDRSGIPYQPIKLSKPVEIIFIIILSLTNMSLTLIWFYLVYRLFMKERCQRACALSKKASYTLLEPN